MKQKTRNYLSGRISEKQLKSFLIPAEKWRPYPTINDASGWASVPKLLRTAYIKNAEKYLAMPWEALKASAFLDFTRNGNRSRYEGVMFERRQRLACLVMAEIFENKGRFLDEIANGIWAIAEETFWGCPACIYLQKKGKGSGLPDITEPIIDLFAAETGALLAWTVYLVGDKLDKVSPRIMERVCY